MNLDQYSLLLTIACWLLLTVTLMSIFAYFFVPKTRERLVSIPYFTYIKLIGVFAIISTLGALIYQFIYGTPVCEYCWWQRIFMFPIDLIVILTILFKIKKNETIILALASIGTVFAAVHYYYHFQSAILGNTISSGCSVVGIIPSCTETPVIVFNFVTIPLMALVAFLAIMWFSFLAMKTTNRD